MTPVDVATRDGPADVGAVAIRGHLHPTVVGADAVVAAILGPAAALVAARTGLPAFDALGRRVDPWSLSSGRLDPRRLGPLPAVDTASAAAATG